MGGEFVLRSPHGVLLSYSVASCMYHSAKQGTTELYFLKRAPLVCAWEVTSGERWLL